MTSPGGERNDGSLDSGAGTSGDRSADAELDLALGRQIRARRTAAGMSLREFSARAELSPSFISQLERGLARPRITSLHRVARVLGTTAQALLSTGHSPSYSLVRDGDHRVVAHDENVASGTVRSLVRGDRPLTAMEFTGIPTEFGEYYEHPGEELYLVVAGEIEVDLDGELLTISAGDCLCYDGRIPHRSRSIGPDRALVYMVTGRDDVPSVQLD